MHYIWPLFQALVCIVVLTFGTYIMVKKLRKNQFARQSQHSLMQIVDGMNIGMNQQMYLVKVGEEYLVATFGNQGVQMLKLEQTTFRDPKESFQGYFDQEKTSFSLQDTVKGIKGRLMKREES